MREDDILQRCGEFIEKNFLYMRPEFSLDHDLSLSEAGIIDSMGVMELIEFLEGEFGIVVADDDIVEANLGTLRSIARYVAARVSIADPATC